MTTLLMDDHLEIEHDPRENILYCRWKGFQDTGKIMASGDLILQHVRSRNIAKVLNDNRDVRGSWQDAARWTKEQWFPAMKAAGLKYFAWIIARDLFAVISARTAMEGHLIAREFETYDEAQQWLIAQC